MKPLPAREGVYGLHRVCFVSCFGLREVQEFSRISPRNQDKASFSFQKNQKPHRTEQQPPIQQAALKRSTAHKKNGLKSAPPSFKTTHDSFFHGRYLKFSAQINDQHYILKLQESKHPDLPAVEYTCNQLAQILELNIPDFYFLDFQNRPCFVTRNFMPPCSGVLQHIYKFLGAKKYACLNIKDVILKHSSSPAADLRHFIHICLFDALIGNHDRHGRNIAFIKTSRSCRLTPMYDNPSYFGICADEFLGADVHPLGCIATQHSPHPNVHEYKNEFCRLGYKKVVDRFKNTLQKKQPQILKAIESSFITQKRKAAFLTFVKQQLKEFENEKA